jgi:bifunctional non-homologous end joining protein LigD
MRLEGRLACGGGGLPRWVKPQLCALVDEPPEGSAWLREVKYDGYRMHARLDHGKAQLLTRSGLDWTHKYPPIASALSSLPVQQAYLDGELCGVRPDGKTSFSLIQAASDTGNADALAFFLFDLLYLDGEMISSAPLVERKERLRGLLSNAGAPLQYSDHQIGRGADFYARACELSLEGIISKRADAPYAPGNRVVGQGQVPEPRRVRGCRLDRPRGLTTVARGTLASVLHTERPIGVCRSRRGRDQ